MADDVTTTVAESPAAGAPGLDWTLPPPDRAVPLTDRADAARVYRRDGVVLVRDAVTDELLQEIRSNVKRYAKWLAPVVPEDWVRREPNGVLRGMYFLERVDPFFADLPERSGFGALVEEVTGRQATFASMETFHKPAHVGSASAVHQDGIYYVGRDIRAVNVWIPLDRATAVNGTLQYWPETTSGPILEHWLVQGDPFFQGLVPEEIAKLGPPAIAEVPPRSLSIHSDHIVHGSPPNVSPLDRLAFAMTFTLEGGDR